MNVFEFCVDSVRLIEMIISGEPHIILSWFLCYLWLCFANIIIYPHNGEKQTKSYLLSLQVEA